MKIYDLTSFLEEFAKSINAKNNYFGHDLMQFDDCLFGNFGLETPCKIIWENSSYSKNYLSSKMLEEYYTEQKILWQEGIIKEIEMKQDTSFSEDMIMMFDDKIEAAKSGELNMFQEIIEIIESVNERTRRNNKILIDLILE